ncbi:MAG TPA: RNA polymerase sigma factor [Vicinamibacterales bacterium]
MNENDLEMARRCLDGDPAAFEAVYRMHAGRLFGLVSRMLGSAPEAEDVLQEIFITAHRKLSGFRGDSSLGTWLYRIAVNHCLDHLRSRGARMASATESLDREDAREPAAVAPVVPTSISRIDLERAIAQLPPGCRAAFVLHDVEGRDHREVARALGISEGTSKSQVHKARMRLRALLTTPARPAPSGPQLVRVV